MGRGIFYFFFGGGGELFFLREYLYEGVQSQILKKIDQNIFSLKLGQIHNS